MVSRLVVACIWIVRRSIIRFTSDATCPVKYFRLLVWKDERGKRSFVSLFFSLIYIELYSFTIILPQLSIFKAGKIDAEANEELGIRWFILRKELG